MASGPGKLDAVLAEPPPIRAAYSGSTSAATALVSGRVASCQTSRITPNNSSDSSADF